VTLGLAVADDKAIYLAIESKGLAFLESDPCEPTLESKLVRLQKDPEIALLVAGGLEHWQYVWRHYKCQESLDRAAAEVARLLELDDCMTSKNQAFGRLVGYDAETARCLRVDRSLCTVAAKVTRAYLRDVEPIGKCKLACKARRQALEAIKSGEDPLDAITRAIEAQFPHEDLRMPVCTAILRAPQDREALG